MDCCLSLCFKDGLVRLLYNLLFTILFVVGAPYYLWRLIRRGDWRRGFWERFGFYDPELGEWAKRGPVIWIHAVSVGEVNLALPLVERLQAELTGEGYQFLLTTTTTTGMATLTRRLPLGSRAIYYPVDLSPIVARALRTIEPSLVVLVEAEIWPNFIWQTGRKNIPVSLVNARLSERSCRGYGRFGFLFKPLFSEFSLICAQTDADAQRWIQLGCQPEAVLVSGNMKFDAVDVDGPQRTDFSEILIGLGVRDCRVLVGGSTHPGEEVMLVRVWRELRTEFDDLFLILVPRHMERGAALAMELRVDGLKLVRRSELKGNWEQNSNAEPPECLLIDTTGELLDAYRAADFVVVGKSFPMTIGGGQNPIEPVALGKNVVVGPKMGNFTDVVRALKAATALTQVPDERELKANLQKMLMQSESSVKSPWQTVIGQHGGSLLITTRALVSFSKKRQKRLDALRGNPYD
ncbi:MAG: 3-deoxy-D-manno-octulosonic acid transferase [Verrucomicrobiia bacterium]